MAIEESAVIRKAKKLLALSKSANENEASLAAARLSELCVRHNIAMTQLHDTRSERLEVKQDLVYASQRKSSWRGILASGIGKGFLVYPLWIKGANLIFAGTPDNLSMAVDTFFYLEEVIERTTRGWMKENFRSGKADSESFKLGMAGRLARRLRDRREQMERTGLTNTGQTDMSNEIVTQECTALVVSRAIQKIEASNANFIARTYGPVGRPQKSRYASRSDAYYEGQAAGDRVSLDRSKSIRGGTALPE